MTDFGERRASSGRSRSRSAAFTQTAAQDVERRGSGDGTQEPLTNPNQTLSQELPGYIAPLPSELAVSVSTDQPHRKRKWQSGSQEDERPSTSYRRAAKRSRREAYVKGPLLGRGGFGSVYAGTRRSDGLPVAIKYVSKSRTPERLKVEGQGRLPLEVALMTLVNSAPACPNVLQLLDWFDRRRRYTMILERPDPCQDLETFCEENGPLDESLAKKVLLQLITALKHCESRGVLHRDVKPENLLISTESHDIKLLDFGCGDRLKRSAYKYFAGTLQFAPPEWFRRHRYHAGPATVWSVGVTLYNILCGCFPFRGSLRVTSKSRLHFPRELSTGKRQKSRPDPECRQLIGWCLSAAPSDRPTLDHIESHPWVSRSDTGSAEYSFLITYRKSRGSWANGRHKMRGFDLLLQSVRGSVWMLEELTGQKSARHTGDYVHVFIMLLGDPNTPLELIHEEISRQWSSVLRREALHLLSEPSTHDCWMCV
ncbi:serine/threonine-protein kinase pim-3-like [Garra rufa]|uniref:serine/threonine-protein kinase pim-3-like n=1 Tax=Garra rufa TaxID=137080 RepID=UPI003CCE688C